MLNGGKPSAPDRGVQRRPCRAHRRFRRRRSAVSSRSCSAIWSARPRCRAVSIPRTCASLMQAYQEVCRQVVDRYEGHVAQYLGDGLMVYFGWPRAHEDDAHRAVRAALEIVEEIKRSQAAEPLHVRIGIGTGPVVIGETGWGDAAVPRTAVGETPNVVARMQTLAGPDQVVIAASTQRLAAGSFEYEDLGEHTLSGIGEPLRVWRVVGESRARDRFAAAHGPVLTPLIGRETEITMLREQVGAGARRRRPGGAALWPARHGQEPHHAGVVRARGERAALVDALSMLAVLQQLGVLLHSRQPAAHGALRAHAIRPKRKHHQARSGSRAGRRAQGAARAALRRAHVAAAGSLSAAQHEPAETETGNDGGDGRVGAWCSPAPNRCC